MIDLADHEDFLAVEVGHIQMVAGLEEDVRFAAAIAAQTIKIDGVGGAVAGEADA
ncbi:hypothetical protein D3C72_2223690 [compost metagenome]